MTYDHFFPNLSQSRLAIAHDHLEKVTMGDVIPTLQTGISSLIDKLKSTIRYRNKHRREKTAFRKKLRKYGLLSHGNMKKATLDTPLSSRRRKSHRVYKSVKKAASVTMQDPNLALRDVGGRLIVENDDLLKAVTDSINKESIRLKNAKHYQALKSAIASTKY